MPESLGAKYPTECTELKWQWLFPQKNRWRNKLTGEEGRFHIDESLVSAVRIRTIQELSSPMNNVCCNLRYLLTLT